MPCDRFGQNEDRCGSSVRRGGGHIHWITGSSLDCVGIDDDFTDLSPQIGYLILLQRQQYLFLRFRREQIVELLKLSGE